MDLIEEIQQNRHFYAMMYPASDYGTYAFTAELVLTYRFKPNTPRSALRLLPRRRRRGSPIRRSSTLSSPPTSPLPLISRRHGWQSMDDGRRLVVSGRCVTIDS
ncbi:hypothetical protein AKJ16_DCAP09048 [Drosera capensis]